ncbi:MAG TPA: hypothetical protein VL860_11510, partial [Planctomycetota bacterium]|nr:hypothetical protein [Planctomycetota bacterium]
MNQDEQDLQLDLRLMAYLDRQMPAAEAVRLEAEMARDPAVAARFAAMKASLSGLDTLMSQFSTTVETKTPPDWSSSLAGAMAKMEAIEAAEALPQDIGVNIATMDAPEVLAPTPRGRAAHTKVIPIAKNRWMHTLGAVAAVAAAVLLMVFAMQAVPYLPLQPQAAPLDHYALPEPLKVTVDPEQARPVTATAQEITPEQLQALGLSQAQAEQFLRDGVVILSHNE